jgi:two-component system, cell cycle response regulator
MSATTISRRALRIWQATAVLGLAAFTLHVAIGLGGPGSDTFFNHWVYCALLFLSAGGCAARAATARAERGPWLLLAAGLTAWAIGDTYYTFAFADVASPPFPSVADGFYLAFYPAVYGALMLLVRRRIAGLDRAVWLDGLLATFAAAALGATVLVQAVLRTTDGSVAVVVTNLAYPVGDTLLLALTIGVFALTGWRPGRRWAVIGAGLAASAVADGIFLYQIADGTYREGTLLDALWPASMLLLAHASWLRPERVRLRRAEGRSALATPATCALIGIGVLVYGQFHELNVFAVALAVGTLLAVVVRTAVTFDENRRILARIRDEAVTDALTGLGNRRSLVADLEAALASEAGSTILIIFDLDGFKRYNDTFGHPAGDALLARLGCRLAEAVEDHGGSYRLGGDEFCVLADVGEEGAEALLDTAAAALTDRGQGFAITASFGAVFLGDEARDATAALRIADQRLYAQKHGKRSGRGQTYDALLQALYERRPELQDRVVQIAALAAGVAGRMQFPTDELERLRRAAELHDIGTIAIPDQILRKPGPLDATEWEFVRRHTEIGERILGAAPALLGVSRIVRSTHERWDGMGYPDGLAGEEIPPAARVIAVCDAFAAMTSDRPHRSRQTVAQALAELRRGAGTQFDPVAVAVLCEVVAGGARASAA